MIANRQIEELLVKVRTGRGEANLHDIVFELADSRLAPLLMPANIDFSGDRLTLRILRRQGEDFPPEMEGIFERNRDTPVRLTRQEFISARARTEGGLNVRLEDIVPSSPESTQTNYSDSFNLKFGRISFPAEGLDNLSYTQITQVLDALNETESQDNGSSEAQTEIHPEHVLFAILPDTELKIANAGTENTTHHPFRGELISSKLNCFTGSMFGGEFCLEEKESDLLVYYRKQHDGSDPTPSRIFDGVLDAIGLTHCCNPFPVYREERVSGRLRERWCMPRDDINSDCLAPMSSGRLACQSDGQQLFISAAEFFAHDTDLAQACSRALWLMRAACQGNTAHEIRILSLCSILEGLLAPHSGANWGDGSPRLRGEQEWQAAVTALGLDWSGCFSDIWGSFRDFRNSMAHGFRITSNTGDSNELLDAYSRISGGIYITLAQLMNFQGTMERSLLEGLDTIVIGA